MNAPDSALSAETGYNLPIRGSRDAHRPANPLLDALYRWRDAPGAQRAHRPLRGILPFIAQYNPVEDFRLALKELGGLAPDIGEAQTLLAACNESDEGADNGVFLSACYARSAAPVIRHTPSDALGYYIGCRLPVDKLLALPPGDYPMKDALVGFGAEGKVLVAGNFPSGSGRTSKGWRPPPDSSTGVYSTGAVVISGSVSSIGPNERSLFIVTNEKRTPYWMAMGESFVSKERPYRGCVLAPHPEKGLRLVISHAPDAIGNAYSDIAFKRLPAAAAAYYTSVIEPFLPGVPFEDQIAALRELNQDAVMRRFRKLLGKAEPLPPKGASHGPT